jgi:phosphoribosyl-ATP pyrophosphohydrolase/phosphoribosyl-AMP cyclohydrolase/histidinol dehydrogenase
LLDLAILVSVVDSIPQADAVDAAVTRQLATLQTSAVAAIAIAKGFTVVCPDMESAVSITNQLAPEHLEVQSKDSVALASRLTAYGGIFIGTHTAEVFGDYGVGPNHVLPTGGTGRYTGGLSVFTFLRIRTWLRSDTTAAAGADGDVFEGLVADTAALARLEGLRGHERAALRRSKNAVALIAAAEAEAAASS